MVKRDADKGSHAIGLLADYGKATNATRTIIYKLQ